MALAELCIESVARSIGDRLHAVIAACPERLAIGDRDMAWDFAELGARASAIAAHVSQLPPGPIGILTANEARFAGAFFGIIDAGRVAVPLDPEHPDARLRQIADHAGLVAVIATAALAGRARAAAGDHVVTIDADASAATAGAAPGGPGCDGPDAVACVLYTSGSTGAAKGVALTHGYLLHAALVMAESFDLTWDDRLCVFNPFVIAGLRNYLGALMIGASAHVLPPQALEAAGVAREIRARGITFFSAVAPVFRRVADALPAGERLDSVRVVRMTGDRIDWTDYDRFRAVCGDDARFCISLGSTEASMYAAWFVDPALRDTVPRPPVGTAARDFTVEVIDDDGAALPDGAVGELVVTSDFVAQGYWHDPVATDRAFDTAPDGRRRFRTGDMGMRRSDGLIEFAGRKDRLVKLRGHRIEPDDVEAALARCTGVADAAVVVRRDESGAARAIVAYVELERDVRGLLPRHIRAMLSRSVPHYMVPSALVVLDRLPRHPNLKLDRVALAERDARPPGDRSERDADPVLDGVAAAFESVIGCRDATPEDNLFSLGGDSLQGVNILAELEQRFGMAIDPGLFANLRDIRALAGLIRKRIAARRARAPLVRGLTAIKARVRDAMPASLVAQIVTRFRGARPHGERALARPIVEARLLLERGEVEAALRTAREIHEADPGLEWAANLVAYGQGLPPPDPHLRAPDGADPDVQLWRRPDCDTLLICFASGMYLPPALLHRWLDALPASVLYLNDPRNLCYQGGVASLGHDFEANVARLAGLAVEIGARRVACLGSCAGGFGAVRYAIALEADAVLALSPLTDLDPAFNAYLGGTGNSVRIAAAVPDAPVDLRPLFLAAPGPRATLVYGSDHWDSRLHAEHLRGTGVDLRPVAGCASRNVLPAIIPPGAFREMLDALVAPASSAG